jgi:heterodisulfide reductase subunit B
MNFILFSGCKVSYYAPQYEVSSRLVLNSFGIEIEDIEFNCCGYPIRFLDFKAFVFSSARNIALAGEKGLPLLCLCKCCYGTLRYADLLLKRHIDLRNEINELLKDEGLHYPEQVEIKHLLNVLYDDIVLENIQKKIIRPFKSLKIAAHYGCHILRPYDVVQFDNPGNPTKFEKLIEVTGAKSVDWPLRLQCCGDPLNGKNDGLARELGEKKMSSAGKAGADLICVGCTHCQMQFDRIGTGLREKGSSQTVLPSLLYPQLLGLSLGLEAKVLGIDKKERTLFTTGLSMK